MIYVKYITDKANEINKERKEKGYTKADFKETPESKILLENFKNAIEWYEFKDSDKAKEFYKENDRAIAYMKQNNIKIIGEGKERYLVSCDNLYIKGTDIPAEDFIVKGNDYNDCRKEALESYLTNGFKNICLQKIIEKY